MSLEAVERLYDTLMDSDIAELPKDLGLSLFEWTAFCNGVLFDELARWRVAGWPTSCSACGRNITVENGGWTALTLADEPSELQHIVCPSVD